MKYHFKAAIRTLSDIAPGHEVILFISRFFFPRAGNVGLGNRSLGTEARFLKPIFGFLRSVKDILRYPVHIGRAPQRMDGPAIILFPFVPCILSCGFAGIIALQKDMSASRDRRSNGNPPSEHPIDTLRRQFDEIKQSRLDAVLHAQTTSSYLLSRTNLDIMEGALRRLKEDRFLQDLFSDTDRIRRLQQLAEDLSAFIAGEERNIEEKADLFSTDALETINSRLFLLKDIRWGLEKDLLENVKKIQDLMNDTAMSLEAVRTYAQLNYLLNCLDRIEVRGRDSAGVRIAFSLRDRYRLEEFLAILRKKNLYEAFHKRVAGGDLINGSIQVSQADRPKEMLQIAFTYKTASVIGTLGRNGRALRETIRNDRLLHELVRCNISAPCSMAHTRWASVGSITEENCHPVNNFLLTDRAATKTATDKIPCAVKHYPHYGEGNWSINVVLNGDIDNYQILRSALESGEQSLIAPELTTDTKIIPIVIEQHLLAGQTLTEAFRMAVTDFEGSHAIAMMSDLEPGKAFLALRGSGQSIYVGLCEDKYIYASELYGLVEGTPHFIKMDGEGEGESENSGGQIFVIAETPEGGLAGIQALKYNGAPIELSEADVRKAEITTRDIDRGPYPHYFLKEISESALSVKKTLRGKYRLTDTGKVVFNLGEDVLPLKLRKALMKKIRHIVVIGHGTAAVAGTAVADGFTRHLKNSPLKIEAKKASELSGFSMPDDLSDTLVIPITQSGTTTDTNRAVAMAAERGAFIVAVVNRRQSDITHKAHGVFYTGDGRDIEMSVASTKAFYSQIVAGRLLALCIAQILGLPDAEIVRELKVLEAAPVLMRRVLGKAPQIDASARKSAKGRKYWAVVGSGPNKAAADEIRIKLSELCYKTISSDVVEDKKHIDLSAEPLIIVCAAGAPESVLCDIVKDVSIFKAHKGAVIVFTDEGETRFDEIADSVISLPIAPVPTSVILNTMAGHLWGYYAACCIDEDAAFFQEFRNCVSLDTVRLNRRKATLYEKTADKNLHLILERYYGRFQELKNSNAFSTANVKTITDIAMLVKYASGKLPLEDFWMEFKSGSTTEPLDLLDITLGHAIDELSRPIDAIRHQAKTVTVGTSRKEELTGLLFDLLKELNYSSRHLPSRNIPVLSRIQRAVSEIRGYTLYNIDRLDEEGAPVEDSTISICERGGVSLQMPSRVGSSAKLMGTKKTIVRTGTVYAGYGKSDGAALTLIPLLGDKPGVRSLLIAHVRFNETLSATEKISILGERYNDVRNLVNEYNLPWDDRYLENMPIGTLLGESVEFIAAKIKKTVVEK